MPMADMPGHDYWGLWNTGAILVIFGEIRKCSSCKLTDIVPEE